MTPPWLTRAARSVLTRVGLDIRRAVAPRWGSDAFLDQARLLQSLPVEVVFDGGANVGDTVDRYRRLFPQAQIHAFEPFGDAVSQLAARFDGAPNVRPHQVALADGEGVRQLYLDEDSTGNSLLPVDPEPFDWSGSGPRSAANQRVVEVRVTTIDEFCRREGIGRIDVLKLELQGGEGLALSGARAMLRARAIRVVYTEVLFTRAYAGQAFFTDIAALMAGLDYQLFGLYNLAQGERGLCWADAIFRPFADSALSKG
jgi:FkbM family methyltransferase